MMLTAIARCRKKGSVWLNDAVVFVEGAALVVAVLADVYAQFKVR
jgi:hypothetical protein